jgi:hypothetical protein
VFGKSQAHLPLGFKAGSADASIETLENSRKSEEIMRKPKENPMQNARNQSRLFQMI